MSRERISTARREVSIAKRSPPFGVKILLNKGWAMRPLWELEHENNCKLKAGMQRINQVVLSIDKVNVHAVRISPRYRPRRGVREPVAAKLEAWLPFDDHRPVDDECVLTAEAGAKLVVRNTAVHDGTVL